MKCEACLPLVGEFFDGELEPRLAAAVRAHIAGCESCSIRYESLRLNQDIYDKFLEDVKLSSIAWQGVHRRIQEKKTAGTAGIFSRLFAKQNWLLVPRFQFAAAVLALIVLGFMVLRLATRPEQKQEVAITDPARVESPNPVNPVVTPERAPEQPLVAERRPERRRGPARRPVVTTQPQTVATTATVATLGRAAAFTKAIESARTELEANRPVTLKTDVARHFEKTRLLLLSLKNTPVSETDTDVNVSYEKTVSRKLANSNLLLRRETTTAGDRSAAELLDRIEPLLIEIANLPDRASPKEVELISQRIARKDVMGLLQSQSF